MAPGAARRPVAGALCPRRLHAAARVCTAGTDQQKDGPQLVVQRQRGDVAGDGTGSATSRRGDRLLQCAAYVEPETGASSSRALRRAGRRRCAVRRTVGAAALQLLSACKGTGEDVSGQVSRWLAAGVCLGRTAI